MKKTNRGPDEHTDWIQDNHNRSIDAPEPRVISAERKALEERIESNPWVCCDCGLKYYIPPEDSVATATLGSCVVCQEVKRIVHIRNYKWLREVK